MKAVQIFLSIALSSSVLAQSKLTIKNQTYPERSITVECIDSDCNTLSVRSELSDIGKYRENVLYIDQLERSASLNVSRTAKQLAHGQKGQVAQYAPGSEEISFPWSITLNESADDDWREGKAGVSILKRLASPAALALDVGLAGALIATSPAWLTVMLLEPTPMERKIRRKKKGSKRVLKVLSKNDVLEIKNTRYEDLERLLLEL